MKTTVYTVVPIERLESIKKYGLVPNDKLVDLNIPEYSKRNNFRESEMGYIYNSTCIKNSIEWYRVIRNTTLRACFLLKYEVDVLLLESDKCSPDKIKVDTRIKGITIKPEDITIVKVDVYKDYYSDFNNKEEIALTEVSDANLYKYLINDYYLKNDIRKEGIRNKDKNKKDVYYTVTLKRVYQKLLDGKKLYYRFIGTICNMENFKRANFPSLFTTDLENAIGWKNISEHIMKAETIILKCNIKNDMMIDNKSGISNTFCDAIATRPVNTNDIIEIIS